MTKEISEDDSINNSDSGSDEELPLAFHVKAVYDWVGSLSPLPGYFPLYLPQPHRLLSPSESIIVATK